MVSNFEHPVLMKVLAGLTLPREKPAMEIDETRAGRAPMPFVFAGLALVTGLFARALAGDAAGLAAAALVAVEPTLRGHGTLVQSDVLVTFFLVAAALALEHAARGCGGSRDHRGSSRAAFSTASRWRRNTLLSRSSRSSPRRGGSACGREHREIFFESE